MIAHEIFALIYNEKVMNVVVGEYGSCNDVAKGTYGIDAFAVECTQYGCSIGDKFIDGTFYYADGTAIQYLPTQEQEVTQLKALNAELTLAIADMIGGVSDAQ